MLTERFERRRGLFRHADADDSIIEFFAVAAEDGLDRKVQAPVLATVLAAIGP